MKHFFENIDGFSSFSEQGELLVNSLSLINCDDIKIAEIGVYKGRCTSMWNVELINRNINYSYYAIDHFLGSNEHDKNIDYHQITVSNLESIKNKLKIIKNDSLNECKKYDDGFFDIVYIDASHEYEFIKEDIINWLPKVKKGGIICGDDYIAGWPGVIRAVDEIFKNKVNKIGIQQWWVKV